MAWSRTWHVVWGLLILTFTTLLSLWALNLVKVKIKYFWFVTWPLDRCFTWLCGWGPFVLSHHPAKFGVHRPRESGDITSLICHVTTGWYAMWLYGWGPSILSHQPAKFGIHMPSKSRDITSLICHVTMWSMYHVTLWVGFPHPRSPRCKIWDL